MHIPDFLPNITNGYRSDPRYGGCVMQVTSFLYNGGWTDKPDCTDTGLANVAIAVNDCVTDEARRGMLAAVAELSGTAFFDIEPEVEDAAVSELERWTRETFPYGADKLTDETFCDGCCDRWTCFAERLEMFVNQATSWLGQAPNFEGVFRSLDTSQLDPRANQYKIAELFGPEAAACFAHPLPDWRERQVEVVNWFVTFVRKYREVFGAADAAKEVTHADWRRVADHMAPA